MAISDVKFFPLTAMGVCIGVIFYAMASVLTWIMLKWIKREGIYEAFVFCAFCFVLRVIEKYRLYLLFDKDYIFRLLFLELYPNRDYIFNEFIDSVGITLVFLFGAACSIIFRFFLLKRQLNDFLALGFSFLIVFILMFIYQLVYLEVDASDVILIGMLAAIWYYVTRIPVQSAPEEKVT